MEPIDVKLRMADDEYVLAAIRTALGDVEDSSEVAQAIYLELSNARCIILCPDTDERGSYGFQPCEGCTRTLSECALVCPHYPEQEAS